jgi:hypothetical protein
MLRHVEASSFPGIQSPLLVASVAHLVCAVACGVAAATGFAHLPLEMWLLIEGVSVAVAGRWIGLPWWWAPINLLFFPAIYILLYVNLSPTVFLGLFLLTFLVNGAAWFQRVPLFLSSNEAVDIVRTWLPPQAAFRFIDLGCGTGSLLSNLRQHRPDGCYSGMEIAPVPYLLSCWRTCRDRAIEVRWGSFWHVDLGQYDVVYVYLSPAPMARLWSKACREMRPGSLLISNGFSIPGVVPTQTRMVGDMAHSTLYVWKM